MHEDLSSNSQHTHPNLDMAIPSCHPSTVGAEGHRRIRGLLVTSLARGYVGDSAPPDVLPQSPHVGEPAPAPAHMGTQHMSTHSYKERTWSGDEGPVKRSHRIQFTESRLEH